jgi:adenylate cyclase
MRREKKKWLAVLIFSGVAVALALSARGVAFFQLMEMKATDLHAQALKAETPPEVILLVIDQKSIEEYPEPLLFWHKYYAEAIRLAAASGAKVLGLDVAFAIPVDQWSPGLDQELAAAVVETAPKMPVICGVAAPLTGRQREWPVPLNMACAALGQVGFVNLRADEDDFIRSVELVDETGSMKAMSLAVAERYLGRVPYYPSRTIRIRHAGPAGTVKRISLCDFLSAGRAGKMEELRRWVGGKALLMGPDLLTDRHATPYYAFRAGTPANTAGVEIHASAVSTLLKGEFPKEPPASAEGLALGLVVLATVLSGAALRGWPLAGAQVGIVAGAILATHVLFRMGWVMRTSELLLGWLSALVLSLAWSYATASKRGDAFRRAVALFAGKSVAETVEDSGTVTLGGRREQVTILFTDIRGFTAFSETQEPEEVVARLNEYFQVMTGIIVRYGGHVNKFIGDGILAIFTEKDGIPGDHALRAIRCARAMVSHQGQFKTGAGVHTGWAVVGNVGSGDKMDYTALGDTVNLASRLEGLNKEFGSSVVLSNATRERLHGLVATKPLGQVMVKGKTEAQTVFTIEEGI